jgi:hypothetical protein
MRSTPLVLALAAALLAACTTPCEELGNKICECTPAGSARSSCEDSVKQQLEETSPDENVCERALDQCSEPSGTEFCDWIRTAEAKIACGIAYGDDPAAPPP